MSDREHLVRFRLKSGEIVDMHRQDGDVIISKEHQEVIIPGATGQQTLDLAAFFESLGEIIEVPEETEGGE